MGFTRAVAVLALAAACSGYAVVPDLRWPEEYHFNAEEIDLIAGIVKPFEIWYSEKHNRSRIDLFGGITKRYYESVAFDEEDYEDVMGKIYMVHPSADRDANLKVECEIDDIWYDHEEFLPALEDFVYKGIEEHAGKEVQVWVVEEDRYDVMREEKKLLIYVEDGVGIPYHLEIKSLDLKRGELQGHSLINYYNFESGIQLKDVEPNDVEGCERWSMLSSDLHEALKSLHPDVPSDVGAAFHRYKLHHGKNYKEEEHELRKKIFHNNWKYVIDQNNKNLGFKLAINQFADKSVKELAYLNGLKSSEPIRREGTLKFPHTAEEVEAIVEDLPKDFDLRLEGVITRIQNQASCGSCWAFAAAATLEGAFSRSLGRLIDFSEQSLVDCAWAFKSHGCSGTEAIDAVYEYLTEHGIPTYEEYGPYLGEDGACNIKNMTNLYMIKGYTGVTPNSPNALKVALNKYGPVTVGVEVSIGMMLYKSGVLYDFTCEPQAMNHAVVVVGYGYRDGDLYWIIKNSWGEAWGEDGYLLISARDNNCNVMTVPFYPVV